MSAQQCWETATAGVAIPQMGREGLASGHTVGAGAWIQTQAPDFGAIDQIVYSVDCLRPLGLL